MWNSRSIVISVAGPILIACHGGRDTVETMDTGECPSPAFRDPEELCSWLEHESEDRGGCGADCVEVACTVQSTYVCAYAEDAYQFALTSSEVIGEARTLCEASNEFWHEDVEDDCVDATWTMRLYCAPSYCL